MHGNADEGDWQHMCFYTRCSIETHGRTALALDNGTSKSMRDGYQKKIHIDELEFMYQMCFAIHKCKTESRRAPAKEW